MGQIQMRKDKHKVEKRIKEVTKHLLYSCQKANEWGIGQILCEIVQFGCDKNKESFCAQKILQGVIGIINELKMPFPKDVLKALDSNYPVSHLVYGEISCKKCSWPKNLKKKARQLIAEESKRPNNPGQNWPENKPFVLNPLLIKGEDFILFCIPTGVFAKHIKANSKAISIRKPKAGVSGGELFLSTGSSQC